MSTKEKQVKAPSQKAPSQKESIANLDSQVAHIEAKQAEYSEVNRQILETLRELKADKIKTKNLPSQTAKLRDAVARDIKVADSRIRSRDDMIEEIYGWIGEHEKRLMDIEFKWDEKIKLEIKSLLNQASTTLIFTKFPNTIPNNQNAIKNYIKDSFPSIYRLIGRLHFEMNQSADSNATLFVNCRTKSHAKRVIALIKDLRDNHTPKPPFMTRHCIPNKIYAVKIEIENEMKKQNPDLIYKTLMGSGKENFVKIYAYDAIAPQPSQKPVWRPRTDMDVNLLKHESFNPQRGSPLFTPAAAYLKLTHQIITTENVPITVIEDTEDEQPPEQPAAEWVANPNGEQNVDENEEFHESMQELHHSDESDAADSPDVLNDLNDQEI